MKTILPNPEISIITPTYMSGAFIEKTIKSINAQKKELFEHIVIDGCSNDGTQEVLKKYKDISWVSESDSGQTNAINKGFKMAKGNILAWQNADDLYLPGAFEYVVDFFENNPDVDIIYGPYELIDEKGNYLLTVNPIKWHDWKFKHWRFVPMQPTVFWRRKVYEAIGELDENLKYTMDVDFFAKVVNYGFKFKKVGKVLGQFRIHNESKTQNADNWKEIKSELTTVLSKNFNFSKINHMIFNFYFFRSRISNNIRRRLKL